MDLAMEEGTCWYVGSLLVGEQRIPQVGHKWNHRDLMLINDV